MKEMTQAIDNYVEADGHEINRGETKQNKWNKSWRLRYVHLTICLDPHSSLTASG